MPVSTPTRVVIDAAHKHPYVLRHMLQRLRITALLLIPAWHDTTVIQDGYALYTRNKECERLCGVARPKYLDWPEQSEGICLWCC